MNPADAVAEFVQPLQRCQRKGDGYVASCPCSGHTHGDRNPSLKVWAGEYRIMAHCYANLGHRWQDVYAAIGYREDQWMFTSDDGDKILDTYEYVGEDGEPVFRVRRKVPKAFDQQGAKPGGGWYKTLGKAQLVPYRLPELRDAIDNGKRVYLVEGERDVHRLEREGLVATTTPMGCGNWKDHYARWFRSGVVAVIPDNDPGGHKYATTAATDIAKVAKDVRVVTLDGLPDKGDVTDWLRSHTAADLEQRASQAAPFAVESTGAHVTTDDDAVTFTWPTDAITITIDRIGFATGNVHGEIAVSFHDRRLVAYQRINLQSASQERELYTKLNRTTDDKTFPWHDYITPVIARAVEHFRTVGRFIDVTTLEDPGPPTFLVGDLWPDMGRPSLLFGDSESAKSVIASALATSIAAGVPILGDAHPNRTGPVAYLDWEDDADLFRYRLGLICAANDIALTDLPIRYYHPNGPLYQIADSLAREMHREGVIACVIDSRGPAQSGSLSSDDDTNRFFDAIDGLGVRTLIIDHLDKNSIREGGEAKHSFGSVFTRGRVVSSWHAKKNAQGGATITVTLSNAKWNHGPRQQDRSYVIDWSQGLRIDRRGQVWEDPVAGSNTTVGKIARVLNEIGAGTATEIANAAGGERSGTGWTRGAIADAMTKRLLSKCTENPDLCDLPHFDKRTGGIFHLASHTPKTPAAEQPALPDNII